MASAKIDRSVLTHPFAVRMDPKALEPRGAINSRSRMRATRFGLRLNAFIDQYGSLTPSGLPKRSRQNLEKGR
jgi:hypothetical protein